MRDEDKSKEQLIAKLVELRQRIARMERSETQYEQNEETLLSNLSTIFDYINVVIYVVDMKTYEILFINKYGKDLFGTDIIGVPCFKVFHAGQSKPCSFCTNDRLVRDGKPEPPYIWEFQNIRIGKWVKCIDKAIPWSDGRLVRMEIAVNINEIKSMEDELRKHRGNLEDLVKRRTVELKAANGQLQKEIAERKQVEKALDEQLQIFELFFKHTLTSIALLDSDFNFIRVNESYAKADERDVSDFPGHNHFEFYPSDVKAIFENVVETKQPFQAFARPFTYHDHPERGVTYWDWTLVPVLDGDGKVQMLMFSLNDVTNHKRAEEKIEVERRRMYSLLENIPALVYLQAPDYTISFVNRYFRELFGEPGEKPCYEILHGHSEPCKVCPTFRVFDTNSPENWEWVRFDGKTYQIYNYPFSDIDESPLVLVMGIDITELKQLKFEIARLDRLNLVGEMAAGIGHEIRNPMTTVRGFLQMLRSKDECSKFDEYFNLMIEELDRANSIITEFLSLAKNKAIELKESNLNSIIKALYPLIQADAMRMDENIKLNLVNLPNLLLDEKEIRQLILNLVRNGLEVMSPGGNLSIRTFTDGEEVVLAVKDQGIGIEPDVLEKIGTPFFTTKDNGTGLGLAVCYSIAARNNATIKVETSPNGTIFFIRFKPPNPL